MDQTIQSDDDLLEDLVKEAFDYFAHETNLQNGLVVDKTRQGWPASIAATGLGLSAYPVAVEKGLMTRDVAVKRTLTTLRFFSNSPQGPEPDSTGYKGFYYHFLDFQTGARVWECELSTVDTAFLIAGMLCAAQYFDQDNADEHEIRSLADQMYCRVDWPWALDGGATLSNGWKPETGFLPYRWEGYDESLILSILALGSPTHPLPPETFQAFTSTYTWKKVYNLEYLYAGPLFIHQYSHIWINFSGIRDAFMRQHGLDYFENSRRATLVHRQYAIQNPHQFEGYNENLWGITASDGPGPKTMKVNGIIREFYDYLARGVPFGPDDGTVAPWAVVASLPFAPEVVLPAIRHFNSLAIKGIRYGYKATFNPTYPEKEQSPFGWVSPYHFGINQGPIILMIENYRSKLIWNLMCKCKYLVAGLRKAGFTGGWLDL